jgi:hypothetical protein
VFPQQVDLQRQFNKAGIDVNDPIYGAWWDATKGIAGNHPSMSKVYNDDWNKFFQGYELQNISPTKQEVLNYGKVLAKKYQFEVRY